MADGLSYRMERIRAMGNAVVPEVAKIALSLVKSMNESMDA